MKSLGDQHTDFRDDYSSGLRNYLRDIGEEGLQSAYEMGRRAIAAELSILDIVEIHHTVLLSFLEESTSRKETEQLIRTATAFIKESLAAFEMAQRGFLEAQETARLEREHAAQLRALADAFVGITSTLSPDSLLQLITDQAREIIGARRAEAHIFRNERMERIPAAISEADGDWDDDADGDGRELVVELRGRGGALLGSIEVLDKHIGEFAGKDEAILIQLGQMASIALENARLYEREHSIAESLQRSLLPERIPQIAGMEVGVRYRPGSAGMDVGGDWYDVFTLPGGHVGLAIGDVAGRGIRAASIMGQLRSALRAYVLEDFAPEQVVNRLDRFLQELDPDNMATMIYLVVEPETATVEFVNAGHPAPLLLGAEGKPGFLEADAAMPLGVVQRASHKKSVTRLEEGATLLMYTDGLVERPGVPIDEGLARLSVAATESFSNLEDLCDRVLVSMVPGEAKDDVALLAFRLITFSGESFDLRVRAEPNNLPRLRHAFRRWLEKGGAGTEVAYEIATACSEACANVIDHAYEGAPGDLTVEARLESGELSLVIRDYGRWRTPMPGDRGRGLGLIRALVDSLDVSTGPEGTEVKMRRRLDARLSE